MEPISRLLGFLKLRRMPTPPDAARSTWASAAAELEAVYGRRAIREMHGYVREHCGVPVLITTGDILMDALFRKAMGEGSTAILRHLGTEKAPAGLWRALFTVDEEELPQIAAYPGYSSRVRAVAAYRLATGSGCTPAT